MGRSRMSMVGLGRHLRRHDHHTSLFGYSVATASLDGIADAFLTHLTAARSRHPDEPYAIVGHSLGNIITRLLTERLPPGLSRFVMLAPPNRSPALARAMRGQPVFRLFTGDAGQRLGDPEFYSNLARPDVPSMIIAGSKGTGLLAYRGSAPNDGIVSVEETRLADVEHHVVPAVHTFIMNHPRARELIARFLGKPGDRV